MKKALRLAAKVVPIFQNFLVQLVRLLDRRFKLLLQFVLLRRQLVGLGLHFPESLNQVDNRGVLHGPSPSASCKKKSDVAYGLRKFSADLGH
jgi:hypothetical protein